MGFRTASTQYTQTKSARSSDYSAFYNATTGNASISGTSLGANSSITTVTVTPGANASSSTSAISGGGGGSSIAIASIQYLDANNAVISGDIAVSTLGGNILINGTGFVANSNVYVNNTLVSNTFISSTQVRAILPSASAGNVSLMIFTPSNIGAISTNGIRYSGAPTWTTAAVSFQNGTAANVSLVASSDSTLTYTLQAGSTLPTGISLNSAGYLAGTVTGYSGTTSSTAVIVATDLEGQATQQTLNITVTTSDPQFPYTTLLLNGDAGSNIVNGATNNTFIDSSTNNLTITRVNNATQGSFSPYSPTGWSINYPALAYMTYAANPIGTFGTGATFTVEAWVNMTSYAATNYFFSLLASCDQATATYWAIGIGSTGLATVYWYDGATKSCAGSTALAKGTWYHVAINVTAGVVKIYINGNPETLTGTTTLTNPTGNSSYTTGCERGSSNGGSSGYISNLRTNTGALYPSSFTPSTTALTNVTNTTLLTAQSNRYVDNSSSARVITPFATTPPSIQAYSPFSPSAAYTPSIHSGSAYFDGTSSDYLTTPANSALTLGGDFTIECWVYTTIANQTYGSGILGTYDGGSNGGWSLTINRSSGGYGIIFVHANALQQTTATYLPTNTWHHIAIARSGSTLKTFLNGAQVATGPYATTDAVSATCYIGSQGVGSYHSGYISDVRVIKGTALYTAPFTPPTNSLTSPPATPAGLLLNMANGGIVDAHSTNVLKTVGGAQLSTATKKYGTASMSFSGSGQYLTTPALIAPQLFQSTSDWTIEFWFNTSTAGTMGIIDTYNVNTSPYSGLLVQLINGTVNVYDGGSNRATTATYNNGAWHHFAWSNSGGTSRVFVDGTNVSVGGVTSWSTSSNIYRASVPMYIGKDYSPNYYTGYIDDLRITKGLARYTANFTPATSQFLGQ